MQLLCALVLKPFFRNNVDLVFLLQENSQANLKRIFAAYGNVFESFDAFKDAFKACTKNYGCMVINNASKSSNIEDICYWYKAKLHSNNSFKLGSKKLWKYHNKHYNNKYEQDNEVDINVKMKHKQLNVIRTRED